MERGARFGWTELATSDLGKAARFYARLLGWRDLPQPLAVRSERALEYTLFALGGRNVGGMHPLLGAQREQGVSRWTAYVFVADVAATATRAAELGASVLAGPVDVGDLGRMAILRDPLGAQLGLWQPWRIGREFQTRNEPGFACWHEHVSKDPEGAARFYAGLFGWSPRTTDGPGGRRVLLEEDGAALAGASGSAPYGRDVPAHWLTFFQTADCEAFVEKLASLLGAVLVPPHGAPDTERFLVARDPQGAAFGLLSPAARR